MRRREPLRAILARIEQGIRSLQQQGDAEMLDLTAVQAAVANTTTVDASIVTLLNQIAAQLVQTNGDQAAVDAIAQTLQDDAANIAAAVVANTPVAPATSGPTVAPQPGVTPGTAGSSAIAPPIPGPGTTNPAVPAENAAPVEQPPVEHPAGFVPKLVGESYNEYVARATAAGMGQVLDAQAWGALDATPLT